MSDDQTLDHDPLAGVTKEQLAAMSNQELADFYNTPAARRVMRTTPREEQIFTTEYGHKLRFRDGKFRPFAARTREQNRRLRQRARLNGHSKEGA